MKIDLAKEKRAVDTASRHFEDLEGDFAGLYGSDGTRTRDLRRDRPAF